MGQILFARVQYLLPLTLTTLLPGTLSHYYYCKYWPANFQIVIHLKLSTRGPRPRVDRKGQCFCSRPPRAFSSDNGFSKLFFAVLRATTSESSPSFFGVYFITLDGNDDQMTSVFREKAEEWAEQIRVGHLLREESWRALRTARIKTIEYPLF